MARPRNPEIGVTEQLRPVAAPVDSYVRPAQPERSSLWQVAESLSGLDRNLSDYMGERQAKNNELDRLRGEQAFYQNNQQGYAEGVKNGSIPSFASPAFMEGYKATQGAVAGQALALKFQQEYMQWDGKDGTDPAAFEGFLTGFLKRNLGENQDPYVLRGLLPQVRAMAGAAQGTFLRDLNQNTYKTGLQTHGAYASQAIQQYDRNGRGRVDPKTGAIGTDYNGLWSTLMEGRQKALSSGVRAEDYDAVLVDNIVGEALRNRDPRLLELLDRNLPGQNFKITDTPAGRKAKEEGTHRMEVLWRQAQADEEHQQRLANQQLKTKATNAAIESIMADPYKEVPEDVLQAGSKVDPDFRINVLSWQKTVRENQVAEDPRAVREVQEEVFNGGGMAALERGLKSGVIRSPETMRSVYNFAKAVDSGLAGKVLGGPNFLGTMNAIKDRTRDDKLTNPFDPNSGLSDSGLQAQATYQRALMEWAIKNPNATELEILETQRKIGDAVLGGITDGGIGKPKGFTTPDGMTPGNPNFKPQQPAPTQGTPQPAAPAAPQKQGTNWWQNMPVQPGQDPAEARAIQQWTNGLPPANLRAIENFATTRGMTPAQAAQEMYRRLNKRSDASPAPATQEQPQTAQDFMDGAARLAFGPEGQAMRDVIGEALGLNGQKAAQLQPVDVQGLVRSNPIAARAAQMAQAEGLPPEHVLAILKQESNFNPTQRPVVDGKPLSSAFGIGQLLHEERVKAGIGDSTDPEVQLKAVMPKMRDAYDRAQQVLGRPPTPGEMYVVYYQGAGAGPRILANPSASLRATLDAVKPGWGTVVYNANPWLIRAGVVTNEDFIRWTTAKMDAALGTNRKLASAK